MDKDAELKIAKEIYGGKFELICKRMQLLICPTYGKCWLEGTGVIRADERGGLSFQMVAPHGNMKSVPPRSTVPPGQMYSPTDYVMLCAIDQNGREWRSNWFVPSQWIGAFRNPNWIVNQALHTIGHSSERVKFGPSIGRQYIPSRRDLAFDSATRTVKSVNGEEITTQVSADHHVQKIADAYVEFRELEREWLLVETKQETVVMPNWAGLVCQSLSYATARTIRPVVDVRIFDDRYDIGLFSGPFLDFKTHLSPPMIHAMDAPADFWSMVQKFVEWSVANPKLADPLFEELAGIRSGATGSMETASLTLAIGIEAIAGILLANEPPKTRPPVDAEQILLLKEHVKAWDGSKNIRDRASELLGSLDGKPKPIDRLYGFANRVGISDAVMKQWKLLRNEKAHGQGDADAQNRTDRYYAAVELQYRLIGDAIGYSGKIAKTSQRGWDMENRFKK